MKLPRSIILTRMTTPLVHTDLIGDVVRESVVDFDLMEGHLYRGQRIDVTDMEHSAWSLWHGWVLVLVWWPK